MTIRFGVNMHVAKNSLIAVFLGLLTALPAAHAIERPRIVVFEFAAEGVSAPVARLATQRMRSQLTDLKRVDILERAAMDSILAAHAINLDDCTEEGCGIRAGKILDAELIVLGDVIRLKDQFSISARLVDLETGRQLVNQPLFIKSGSEDKVIDLVPQLARTICSGLDLKAQVVQIEDETIYIDAGTGFFEPGQRLEVRGKDAVIRNPNTGEIIGHKMIGRIEVVKLLEDDCAECQALEGTSCKVGDFIKVGEILSTGSTQQGAVFQPEIVKRRPDQADTYGSLQVESSPTGACVFLDGDEIGVTPLSKDDIRTGESTLLLQMNGYSDNVQQVTISETHPARVNVVLSPMTGGLTIYTEPEGAWVTFDGISIGEVEEGGRILEKLLVGDHTIRAELDHYYPKEETVVVDFNVNKPITIKLDPKPGAIFVSSTPPGADIILDGKSTGFTTPRKIEDVECGDHKLQLRLDGFHRIETMVKVQPEKTETLTETLEKERQVRKQQDGVIASEAKQSGPLPGMIFVEIPGGSFMMGSHPDEKGREDDEGPQHKVTLKSFYMMTTEVTQRMWKEVMGNNPSHWKGNDLPVESVSWNDCQEFIKKLNDMFPGHYYRLPTEAEWEYACRAGTKTSFYSGDSYSNLDEVGWHKYNSGSKTHPVGRKAANTWDLFDMHGNVWEWCQDWYGDYPSGSVTDPRGPSSGSDRVCRGGRWGDGAGYCRSANRSIVGPSYRYSYLGFRLARSND